MNEDWFLALDGDDIGRRLELFMLTNDMSSLKKFSSKFNAAIRRIVESSSEIEGVDLILFGGDSILLKVTNNALETVLKIIDEASDQFTFSGGYATSMREAYLALKYAKSSGKNRVEGPLSDVIP